MRRASLEKLQRSAARRKPGYLEACLKLGTPTPDGKGMTFTDAAHAQLRRDFGLPLGDAVHAIAGPIARKIKWPCLKGDGTTDLKPNSPCNKIRAGLNRIKI